MVQLDAGDLPTAAALSDDAERLTAEQNRLGREYGFRRCNGKLKPRFRAIGRQFAGCEGCGDRKIR
ncbi:MAG: hypothetical protein ACRDKY_00565 [Solirubrobacteraceae bacterium]